MGNSSDTTSYTNQTTTSAANSLTNFLNNMAKQYASNTAQNTASTQTYSPSEIAKAMLTQATQPITEKQLAEYQSPYQKQVIDATMAQLMQQYGQQQSALTGNAISQGALGGDRAKIAQAALMGEQGRNTASTLAALQQQGYTQALSAAQQDRARLLQAAGLSGGTTVGGSQMTGATTGREAGQTYGTSATSQTGTSHTAGYGTSQTQSDPTLFGLDLGFKADGGPVRRRDSGGEIYGIPDWARPAPMQAPPQMQMVSSPQNNQKNMSTQDMLKLGDKARVQLSKMFSSDGAGAGADMTSLGSSDALGAGTSGVSGAAGTAPDASSLLSSFGGAGADAGVAAGTGAGEAAGALGTGAGEAAGALGKGAAGAGEAAGGIGAGIGEGIGALAALFSDERVKENKREVGRLFDGQKVYAYNYKGHPETQLGLMAQEVEKRHPDSVGEVGGVKTVQYDMATRDAADKGHFSDGGLIRHRAGGGGMSMPGISMQKGIGQNWFDVPTLDPTSGIKGSEGMANGGTVRHRDAGGPVAQPAYAPMPDLPSQPSNIPTTLPVTQAPPAELPSSSNGKGSSYNLPRDIFGTTGFGGELSNLYNQLFLGSGSTQPASYPSAQTQAQSNGKGSGFAFADGGHVRHRFDGGETDQEAPSFLIEQEKQLEAARRAREELAAKQAASSDDVGPSGPANVESGLTKLSNWIGSYSRPTVGSLTQNEINARLDAEEAQARAAQAPQETRPSIADLAPRKFETTMEPVPSDFSPTPVSTFRIDPMTGKEIGSAGKGLAPLAAPAGAANVVSPSLGAEERANAKPAPEGAANLYEPGAEEIAPDKPKNHALTVNDVARAEGLSENGARALLANAQDESGFNPDLRHPDQPKFTGEAHYAHGLFQIGGAKWNEFEAWRKENSPDADWRDPAVQTKFVIQDLKNNYPSVWKTMNEGTPEEGAQAFLHGWERPAQKYAEARHEKYGRGVLGVDEYTATPSTVSRREEPSAPVKAGAGVPASGGQGAGQARSLAALTQPSASPGAQPVDQQGNLITRLLDAGFNPLKMSDKDLTFIAQTALGGMGGINKAAETAQGTRQQDIAAQQHALQMSLEAQKLQHQLAQPTVMGETYDQSTGLWHKQYGAYNPQASRYEPIAPAPGSIAAAASGPVAVENVAPDKAGDDFIVEAKKAGYSSAVLNDAKRVAEYKVDPAKLASAKGEQRAIIDRLASRINPEYDGSKYAAAADSEKKLASGDVAKALRSIGRLFDEVEQTVDLAKKTGNTRSEYANRAMYESYPSGSDYGRKMAALGTGLNNVLDTAASVAKGGGTGAEGDVKRRAESMNRFQHPETLAAALKTEAEVALKNGQSNLSSYNSAHGYSPENPRYKTIMDQMTPSQQKKAIAMLGADKIEEITGKPVKGAEKKAQEPSVSPGARPIGKSNAQILRDAQEAIAHGVPKEKVFSQLDAWGISH